MSKPTRAQALAAIEVLINFGATAYTDPKRISRGKKFGMGVSKVESDSNFILAAAGEHLEGWNHHAKAAKVRELIDGETVEVDKFGGEQFLMKMD